METPYHKVLDMNFRARYNELIRAQYNELKCYGTGGYRVELRILYYFLMVAREENVTRAANALHLTQPTLSRQLAQLEEELGVKLFDRGKRKITLTAEGVLLHRRAKEILEMVGKTRRELADQSAVEGIVAVGCGDLDAVHRR